MDNTQEILRLIKNNKQEKAIELAKNTNEDLTRIIRKRALYYNVDLITLLDSFEFKLDVTGYFDYYQESVIDIKAMYEGSNYYQSIDYKTRHKIKQLLVIVIDITTGSKLKYTIESLNTPQYIGVRDYLINMAVKEQARTRLTNNIQHTIEVLANARSICRYIASIISTKVKHLQTEQIKATFKDIKGTHHLSVKIKQDVAHKHLYQIETTQDIATCTTNLIDHLNREQKLKDV